MRETGRAARFDLNDPSARLPEHIRAEGVRAAVAAPITVEGRLWGAITVESRGEEPPGPDTEARLAGFTELVATAIANAEAKGELTASRARIVATADQTRRRIERDLHDGAQQRLVSLALRLRTASAAIPGELDEILQELAGVGAELDAVLGDLRELSRGIHPPSCPRAASGRPCGPWPAVRWSRCSCRWGRRAAARAGRGDRLLRRRRGADQRGQARGRLGGAGRGRHR